jgi:general secretion pathway protein D
MRTREGKIVHNKLFARLALIAIAAVGVATPVHAQDEDEFFDPDMADQMVIEEEPQVATPAPVPVEEPVQEPLPEPEPQPAEVFEEEPVLEPEPVIPPQPVRPKVLPTRPPVRPAVRPASPPPPRPAARPSRPAGAENTLEKTGATASEPIMFDFDRAPLTEVIQVISRLTGRNFDVDPNIGGTEVTIITHDKIPPEMAYEVLESILASRGFSLVETLDGHLVKVTATPQAPPDKLKLIKGAEVSPEGYDNFATHIVTVKYADAAELITALKVLGSPNARIDAYVPTNTLIVTDTADGLRRVFQFLAEIDIAGFDTVMEIFTLEYTRAEVIAGQLEQVLLDTGATGGAAATQAAARVRPTRPTANTRGQVPGAATAQVIGSREETLRMVPDERLNALIVVASEGMMERLRDLVIRLDTPTPYEANNLHIYELLNADAELVEQAIQPLVGTAPRSQGGSGGPARAGGGAAAAASSGGGGGAAGDIQPFEQKVQITRYDQTNSLLIVASPQDYKLLEAFIARLDVPQRQVAVDAVVMDVTIENNFGLTVDLASLGGEDGFAVTNTANILQVAGTAQQLANPGALALGVLGLGSTGGVTTGIFSDLDVDLGNGQTISVPFVPLLIKATEKLTDVEVLSEPSLVTVDNEEASILVGQEVPFITSTSRPNTDQDGVSQGFSSGFTRVQREEVGIKLKVTPQISEGDNVLLEIELEVSDTDATQIGTVDIIGPTTNKSLIQNKVLVRNGYTAVIAGLIRNSAKRDNTQTPILGDLPVLGWLFRSKSDAREKRNMVVLVTPHIIKEGIDYERITQYKMNEYHESNLEELLQSQGLFRKIKKKEELRRQYRPTFNKAEALTGMRDTESGGNAGAAYGTGNMAR